MQKTNLWKLSVKKLILVSLFFSSCAFSMVASSEQIYVFSLNQEFKPLSKNQVKMIFRGKSTRLSNTKIALLDLPQESDTRDSFYKHLLRKNSRQMQVQWASLEFSGKPYTPKELPKNDFSLILSWLEENPNGIAYYKGPLPNNNLNILYIQDVK